MPFVFNICLLILCRFMCQASTIHRSNQLICDTLDFNEAKHYLHQILLSFSNKLSKYYTYATYTTYGSMANVTKLCTPNKNLKYNLFIDYNLLCVYISVEKDIVIWKQCASDPQNDYIITITNKHTSRLLLLASEPSMEPTIQPSIEPTIEPTQEPIGIYPTMEPTQPILLSTQIKAPDDGWNKIIEYLSKHKIWIIIGFLLFILIMTVLIYFLCATYHCCHAKNGNNTNRRRKHRYHNHKNVNHVSSHHKRKQRGKKPVKTIGKRTDRESYESILSDDDNISNIELLPIIARNRHSVSTNNINKKNTQNAQYEAVPIANINSDSEEKQMILNTDSDEKRSILNDSQTNSSSEINIEMITNTKQIANNNNNNNNAMIASQNRQQPIVINIHHNHLMPTDSMSDMKVISPRNDINIATVSMQPIPSAVHVNDHDSFPMDLPNLPTEILDTDTDAVGEGFDLNTWIMQTLKECAPEEWKEYLNNFRKHKITEGVLIILGADKHNKKEEWKELIPLIGPRIRFQQQWEKELLRQQRKQMK